jgi:hypothetical protein
MKKEILLVLVFSAVLLSIIIAYYVKTNSFTPGIPSKPFPLISIEKEPQDVNVTQGMSFSVNLTITSKTDKELSIPLNLTLYVIRNSTGRQVLPEETGFFFRFEPDSLIIEPHGSNSSILSAAVSQDASIGKYQLSVNTGNWEETHVGGTTIQTYVNSK